MKKNRKPFYRILAVSLIILAFIAILLRPIALNKASLLAPIESVEINIAESFPPQYFVHVVSGLPNSCFEFEGYDVKRNASIIQIDVTNLMTTGEGVECREIYGSVDSNIGLGIDFVSGDTYTVIVNDVTKTFLAQ